MTTKPQLLKRQDYERRLARRDKPWTDEERQQVYRRARQLDAVRAARGDDHFPATGIGWMLGHRRWS